MATSGGRSLLVLFAVMAPLSLASCSAGGASDGAAEPAATESDAGRSTTEPERTTTTKAPLRSPDPIPWTEVLAATGARTGRLHQEAGAVWSDTGEQLEGGSIEEVVAFDRDRLLAERTITIGADVEDAPAGPLKAFYTDDGVLMSAPWVEERCGAAWVSLDGQLDAAGLGDVLVASQLFPLDPLGPLASVPAEPDTSQVTRIATTYAVDLPAILVLSPSYLLKNPEVADDLDGVMAPADVTIHDDGELEVEMAIPLSTLSDAGVDLFDSVLADEVSMWTRWTLDRVGEPTDLAEPTDVADTPSCAED